MNASSKIEYFCTKCGEPFPSDIERQLHEPRCDGDGGTLRERIVDAAGRAISRYRSPPFSGGTDTVSDDPES